MMNCTATVSPPTVSVTVGSPVCASTMAMVMTVAAIEPSVGMKFRMKVSMATAPASSSPCTRKIVQINLP